MTWGGRNLGRTTRNFRSLILFAFFGTGETRLVPEGNASSITGGNTVLIRYAGFLLGESCWGSTEFHCFTGLPKNITTGCGCSVPPPPPVDSTGEEGTEKNPVLTLIHFLR